MAHLETLLEFALLFVDYAQAEVDLVCLLEVGLHAHDLRERFFGVLKTAISVIQYANTVPEFRLLQRCQ